MTVFAKVQISEESFREADAMLARLPLEIRGKVLARGLRAAAAPVEKRARQLVPRSSQTGSRRRMAKAQAARRVGEAEHRESIGHSTIREYGSITAIYVGPVHPAGNLINIIGHPHQQVLWGNRTGRVVPPTTYLQQAAAETTGQQQSAFVGKVRSESDKIIARMAR